jgi:hypothetical protein
MFAFYIGLYWIYLIVCCTQMYFMYRKLIFVENQLNVLWFLINTLSGVGKARSLDTVIQHGHFCGEYNFTFLLIKHI